MLANEYIYIKLLNQIKMKIHKLKLVNPFFEDVWSGVKDFEVRKNDRGFKVGDRIQLIEYGACQSIEPRYVLKDIKYVLEGGAYGVEEGYVVLGLKDIYGYTKPNLEGTSCYKCGCQIFSPFNTGVVIHDVGSCGGLLM